MKTQFKLSAAVLLAALGTSAYADPILINYGANGDFDADTTTDVFTQLAFSQLKATSIYKDVNNNGVLDGPDSVYDTNIQSKLSAVFANGSYTSLSGVPNSVALNNSINTGNASISALAPLVFFDSREGFGSTWNLTLQYELFGTYAGLLGGTPFTSGYLDIYYNTDNNPGNQQKLLTLDVTGSLLGPGNLDIFGQISYVGAGPNGNLDFFNFAPLPGISFASLLGQNTNINWNLDTNVDPPIPDPAQLAVVNSGGSRYFVRQTQLDGSIDFTVPEPESIALLGIGLLGFAMQSRKKSIK